jgi:sulfate/thiosulfate transport system permease protein
MATANRRVLPGFRLSLGYTVFYLSLLVLIPLATCYVQAARLTFGDFWSTVWTERTRAAYGLTFGASFVSAILNVFIGILLAWVLVRYSFPLKRIFDALIDLPFALPTAVAGLVFANLYSPAGWLGRFLVPLGIHGAYSRLGIVLVLTFTGLPFVVRTVQPVLETFDAETEEAAATLGASRWQILRRVIAPGVYPAVITGFALSFARAIGEYGSVIFIAGNKRNETEIAPYLIVELLDQFEFSEATAVAVVLLTLSFALLAAINILERWSKSHAS